MKIDKDFVDERQKFLREEFKMDPDVAIKGDIDLTLSEQEWYDKHCNPVATKKNCPNYVEPSVEPSIKTAGFPSSTIVLILIGGLGIYYAYSKGMFKKLIK
jgi:hypothetical protein